MADFVKGRDVEIETQINKFQEGPGRKKCGASDPRRQIQAGVFCVNRNQRKCTGCMW